MKKCRIEMLFVLSVIAGVFNVIAAIYFQVAYTNMVVVRAPACVCVCVSVFERINLLGCARVTRGPLFHFGT